MHKPHMVHMSESIKGRLLIALPNKGRLFEKSLEIMQGADIQFTRSPRLDVCVVRNLPIALVFLPASDIPQFVGRGNVDMGITGRDQVLESETAPLVTEILPLGFGRCSLQVLVPESSPIQCIEELAGMRIVTSYEVLAGEYFGKIDQKEGLTQDQNTTIEYVSGSVEAACALGLADGVVDLVESGDTMRAAGLRPLATVMETEAVLIKSAAPKSPSLDPVISLVKSRIAGVVASKKYVVCQYSARREDLSLITSITPGRRAATVSPLDNNGWVTVSAMVEKKEAASVLDRLVAAGAVNVFTLSLDNCRV